MSSPGRPPARDGNIEVSSSLVQACPLGFLEIRAVGRAVSYVHLTGDRPEARGRDESNPVLQDCARQLEEYFSGKRRRFEIDLDLRGTEFQRRVWALLCEIPFGETASYKDIAMAIGRPAAVRAVGAANGKNPVALIVPCHRVIGHDGGLVGYGGGLWRKKWLLEHEARYR